MTPILCFDIETVPDADGLRRLGLIDEPGAADWDDDTLVEHVFARRREKTGSDFLPLHQHRIVAIACLFRDDSGVRIRCLGSAGDPEARLISDFFKTIDRHTPQLVSWNGSGFDMQVLTYRALVNGVQAARYWELGDDDRDFKWNNYISRYHTRHLDLMDLLALYTPRANAPLDELAKLCGFPGKMGMDGSQVWPAYRQGRLDEIRDYCETDVANTYLMYCRFQRLRGFWSPVEYQREIDVVRAYLGAQPGQHWREFLSGWTADAPAAG